MRDPSSNWILSLCVGLALAPGSAFAAKISYFKGTSNEDLDTAIIERLTDQGHTVTEFLPAGVEEAEQLAEVADQDLVIISETIGSTQVTDTQSAGGAFTLRALPKPIISFEPFHWDEAFWSGDFQFEDFGNTDHACVRLKCRFHSSEIGHINQGELHPKLFEDFIKYPKGAAVNIIAKNDMLARLQEMDNGSD